MPLGALREATFVDRRGVPGHLGRSGKLQAWCSRPLGFLRKTTFVDRRCVPGHLGCSGRLLLPTGVVSPATWDAPGSHFCRQAWCSLPLGALRKATLVDRRNVPGHLGSSGKLLLLTGVVFPATWGAPESYFCRQAWCSRPLGALREATFVDSFSAKQQQHRHCYHFFIRRQAQLPSHVSHPTLRFFYNDRPSRRCVSCMEVIASQAFALPMS